METSAHNQSIIDQFTRQAVPFSQRHTHDDLLQLMRSLSQVNCEDTVLDVGCGPGIVACSFAVVARHVTGLDITPAMLDRAAVLQREKRLANLAWKLGDISRLPFPDGSFSLVLTRFTFHHLLSPKQVLAEMIRVCRPGGRVLVVDVAPEADKLAAYDHFEKLRDPSHVHAFPPEGLLGLFDGLPVKDIRAESYSLEMELEQQLAGSFPLPGDADRIRELFRSDLSKNLIGVNAHLRGQEIHFAYPVRAIAATKTC